LPTWDPEDKTVPADFGAAREAGRGKKAAVRETQAQVSEGVLDIEFPHKEGVTPVIDGIGRYLPKFTLIQRSSPLRGMRQEQMADSRKAWRLCQ